MVFQQATVDLAGQAIARARLQNWARKDLNLGPMDYESFGSVITAVLAVCYNFVFVRFRGLQVSTKLISST